MGTHPIFLQTKITIFNQAERYNEHLRKSMENGGRGREKVQKKDEGIEEFIQPIPNHNVDAENKENRKSNLKEQKKFRPEKKEQKL